MKISNLFKKRGQSLVEIIVSVAVGTLIIGSAVWALVVTIQSNLSNRNTNFASTLGQDLLDNVRSVAEGNWTQIYEPVSGCGAACKGQANDYFLAASKRLTNELDLTGTVYVNNGSPSVSGTGTDFLNELAAGSFIDISGRIYKVLSVTNNSLLTLVSPYTGSSINPPGIKAIELIGTASVDGTINVTGTGTVFLTDLANGDYIKIGGQILKIDSVDSDTSLRLAYNYPGAANEGLKIYREFGIRPGTENITPSGIAITYTRSFVIENVNRGNCGTGSITANPVSICSSVDNANDILEDLSTQKITSKVSWTQSGNVNSIQLSEYITRSNNNEAVNFNDWNGGVDSGEAFTQPTNKYSSKSANISTSLGITIP